MFEVLKIAFTVFLVFILGWVCFMMVYFTVKEFNNKKED